jgi:hypothetical protein
MFVQQLMRHVSSDSDAVRRFARGRLVKAGERAVGPLIAAMLDEDSAFDPFEAGSILRQIGRPAFGTLADALATAATEETRRRCSWAFMGFGSRLLDLYVHALSHPSPYVRETAALALQYQEGAALSAVPALLPLLADPHEDVRQRAVWAIAAIGEGALPVLQRVRQHGPGVLRPGALRAIAQLAGDAALDVRDRAAIERLIRIKLLVERPEAIDGCGACGSWLALPTGDQNAIMDSLDLSDPRPATMRLGFAAYSCDRHGLASRERRAGRVFITPQLNGWTLVMGGGWRCAFDDEVVAARQLSERFGAAQAFGFDGQTGWSSYLICTNGNIVRRYVGESPELCIGPRLAVEENRLLFDDFPFADGDLSEIDLQGPDKDAQWASLLARYELIGDCNTLTVADAMSVSPVNLTANTMKSGHGILALTALGRIHGVPAGALPI